MEPAAVNQGPAPVAVVASPEDEVFAKNLQAFRKSSEKLRVYIAEQQFFIPHRFDPSAPADNFNFLCSYINSLRNDVFVHGSICRYSVKGVDRKLLSEFRTILIEDRKVIVDQFTQNLTAFHSKKMAGYATKIPVETEARLTVDKVIDTYSTLLAKSYKLAED